MARPCKLTAQLSEEYVTAYKGCMYLGTAADFVGVHPRTVRRWMKRGDRARGGIYADFSIAVRRAAALELAACVERISNDPSWQSQAWLLERRRPDLWGANRLEIAELKRRLAALEKHAAPPAGG